MKKGIHPQYFPSAIIICSCGNKMTTGATKEQLRTELCSACHPFYTGQQKLIDTAKRVDKFEARRRKAVEMLEKKHTKPEKSAESEGSESKKSTKKSVKKTSKVKTAVKKDSKKK